MSKDHIGHDNGPVRALSGRLRLLIVENDFVDRFAFLNKRDIKSTFDTSGCASLTELQQLLDNEAAVAGPVDPFVIAVLDFDDQRGSEIALPAIMAIKAACDRMGVVYPAVFIYSGANYASMNRVVDKARAMGFRTARSVQKPNFNGLMAHIHARLTAIHEEANNKALSQTLTHSSCEDILQDKMEKPASPVTFERVTAAFLAREKHGSIADERYLDLLKTMHPTEWLRPFHKTVAPIADGAQPPFASFCDSIGESLSGVAVFSVEAARARRQQGEDKPLILFLADGGWRVTEMNEFPSPVQAVVQVGGTASHFKQIARMHGLSCLMIDPAYASSPGDFIVDAAQGLFRVRGPDGSFVDVREGTTVTLDTNTNRLYVGAQTIKDGLVPDVYEAMTADMVKRIEQRGRVKPLNFSLQLDGPTRWGIAPGTRIGLHRTEHAFLCKRTRGALLAAIANPTEGNLADVQAICATHLERTLSGLAVSGITIRLMDVKPDQLFRDPAAAAHMRAAILGPEGTLRGFMARAIPHVYEAQIAGALRVLPDLLPQKAPVTFAVPMTHGASDIGFAFALVQKALCGKSPALPLSIGATIERAMGDTAIVNLTLACAKTRTAPNIPVQLLVGTNDMTEAMLGIKRTDQTRIAAWLKEGVTREHPFRELSTPVRAQLEIIGRAAKGKDLPPTNLVVCGDHAAGFGNLMAIRQAGFDGVSVPASPLYTRGLRSAHLALLLRCGA